MFVLVNVLDVLEGFFGELPSKATVLGLSREQIEELGELAMASASVLADDALDEPAVYPGGWLAGNWAKQLFRGDLNLALLYQPRLLVHDSLADFFFVGADNIPELTNMRGALGGMSVTRGPKIWAPSDSYVGMRDDLDAVRHLLARIIGYFVELAPLLRSGIVIARAQWPTIRRESAQILTSVRHDVRSPEMLKAVQSASLDGGLLPVWDTLRGMHVTPPGGFDPRDALLQWEPEYFYLAKTLAVANAAGAIYSPSTEDELRLLRAKSSRLEAAATREGHPVALLREVARVLVPDMQLDASTAVAIRQSESAFDDWRRSLRNLQKDTAHFTPDELRERVEDELIPEVRAIERLTSRSQAIRTVLKAESAATVISGGVATAVSLAMGQGWIGPTVGVGTGALSWLWKAYRPANLGGRQTVIASLIRAHNDK
ncbi:MAG: hypothetical protein HHJ14_02400 [Cellulomonas sp.]|nr:hypothetical protein [Cellulomonas sp.]